MIDLALALIIYGSLATIVVIFMRALFGKNWLKEVIDDFNGENK